MNDSVLELICVSVAGLRRERSGLRAEADRVNERQAARERGETGRYGCGGDGGGGEEGLYEAPRADRTRWG